MVEREVDDGDVVLAVGDVRHGAGVRDANFEGYVGGRESPLHRSDEVWVEIVADAIGCDPQERVGDGDVPAGRAFHPFDRVDDELLGVWESERRARGTEPLERVDVSIEDLGHNGVSSA